MTLCIYSNRFDERTLLQWTNIDPVGLLQDLSKRYGNYSQTEIKNLINLFHEAGIDHGYLNRSCLDPSDPACPTSAPNYKGELVIEHNSGLQSHIEWKFFAFTNASLLDLLQEITLRLGPITLVGCILMVVI
ncbi:unnamed protein product [Trichobilharzia regenti]|nr:unnamed protein product [Trichobilharzia regenti]